MKIAMLNRATITKWEKSGDLFASWKTHADRGGVTVGNTVNFADNLARRGITRVRKSKGVRGFKGVQLIQSQAAEGGFG